MLLANFVGVRLECREESGCSLLPCAYFAYTNERRYFYWSVYLNGEWTSLSAFMNLGTLKGTALLQKYMNMTSQLHYVMSFIRTNANVSENEEMWRFRQLP